MPPQLKTPIKPMPLAANISFKARRPAHPDLQRLADDVLHRMQYSFLVAARRQEQPFPDNTVEEALRRAIMSRDASRRQAYRLIADRLAALPVQSRRAAFGRYGGIDPDAFRGFANAAGQTAPLDVDGEALTDALATHISSLKALIPEQDDSQIALKFKKVKALRLFITKVRCIDETNPEIGGNDEILMGGLGIDAVGNTQAIKPFMVRDDFEDGVVKAYSAPGREFVGFDATLGASWPKNYAAVVYLAEEDFGGFYDAIMTAWLVASPIVKKEFQAALANEVGGEWGAVLGYIVAFVVEEFIGWIIELMADDVFKPGTAIAGLHTPVALAYKNAAGWKDSRSPSGAWTFIGHGGTYVVKCYWRVEPAG